MPTIPKNMVLTSDSVNVLNAIKNGASTNYSRAVPYAQPDGSNLRQIGNILISNPNIKNEFASALVNMIARVIITSKDFYNPLRLFKKGYLELGETVEEIFVELIDPQQYNPEYAEENVFRRKLPDIRSQFHIMNLQTDYKVTISDKDIKTAFLSWNGVTDLIARIVSRVYTSASYDEFLLIKYLIIRRLLQGQMNVQEIPAISKDTIDEVTVIIKGASNEMNFMRTDNNLAGVHNHSPFESQYLITSAAFNARFTTQQLAVAFNIDETKFLGHQLMIDSFGSLDIPRMAKLMAGDPTYIEPSAAELAALDTIPAILVDESFFQIFDNLQTFGENYNSEGLYWNENYIVWKTFSTSMFAPNYAFVLGTPSVTSITLTPATATVAAGQYLQLTTNVVTENYAPQSVNYVSDSDFATVDASGLVYILPTATSGTEIEITATSTFDSTKTATATITVG